MFHLICSSTSGLAFSAPRRKRLIPTWELETLGRLARHAEQSLRLSVKLFDAELDPEDKRVETLETDLKAVGRDIAEVKGKLSQMPTTFQLMSWFVGVAFALTLLVFTIAKTVK